MCSTKSSHQVAEATQQRNKQIKAAFGISDSYEDGSSFQDKKAAKQEEIVKSVLLIFV